MSTEVKAQNSISLTSVKAIKEATDQSAALLAAMQQYAAAAGTTLTGIYADAEAAKTNAESARSSAESALTNLSQVQSVLDVVNWVAQHGEYELTDDTVINSNKIYYTVTGTSVASPTDDDIGAYYELSGGVYSKTTDTAVDSGKTYYTVVGTPVSDPVAAQLGTYYELSIDEAMSNYIQKHLALTSDGLYVMADDSQWKVLITDDGVYIIDGTSGTDVVVAKYSDSVRIGPVDSYNTRMYPSMFGVYQHSDRLFTIALDDNEVNIYAGSSTFNTTQTTYSEAFIRALIWHLNNKFYVGDDGQTILEIATDEDTGLSLETALTSSYAGYIKVLGVNNQPILYEDGTTQTVACNGTFNTHEFFIAGTKDWLDDLTDYLNNECYVGNDNVIYVTATGQSAGYKITDNTSQLPDINNADIVCSSSYTDNDDYSHDDKCMERYLGTDIYCLYSIRKVVTSNDGSSASGVMQADVSYIRYGPEDFETPGPSYFESITEIITLYYFYNSTAKYAEIGTYTTYETTIDTTTGEETETAVVHLDNGSVVNMIMGGVRQRFEGGEMTITGDLYLDLPDYTTADTTDKAIYDAIVALGWDSDVLVN